MLFSFAEISDEKVRHEAAQYDHTQMKHVDVVEKSQLPSSDGEHGFGKVGSFRFRI